MFCKLKQLPFAAQNLIEPQGPEYINIDTFLLARTFASKFKFTIQVDQGRGEKKRALVNVFTGTFNSVKSERNISAPNELPPTLPISDKHFPRFGEGGRGGAADSGHRL